MSDEIKIEHDQNGNIQFTKIQYEDQQILEAEHMNRIESYLEDIYSILQAKPIIVPSEETVYTSLGSPIIL